MNIFIDGDNEAKRFGLKALIGFKDEDGKPKLLLEFLSDFDDDPVCEEWAWANSDAAVVLLDDCELPAADNPVGSSRDEDEEREERSLVLVRIPLEEPCDDRSPDEGTAD